MHNCRQLYRVCARASDACTATVRRRIDTHIWAAQFPAIRTYSHTHTLTHIRFIRVRRASACRACTMCTIDYTCFPPSEFTRVRMNNVVLREELVIRHAHTHTQPRCANNILIYVCVRDSVLSATPRTPATILSAIKHCAPSTHHHRAPKLFIYYGNLFIRFCCCARARTRDMSFGVRCTRERGHAARRFAKIHSSRFA